MFRIADHPLDELLIENGIKVTTFAVLGFAMWSEVRGDAEVTAFHRRLPDGTVRQAIHAEHVSPLASERRRDRPAVADRGAGLLPGAGGTQRLPRLVGKGKAKELIFTGKRIGAEEALRIGLVNKICPLEDLLTEARNMAAMICEAGPIAIEQAKYAIDYGLETDLNTGLAIESNAYWITIPTNDRLEGLAAFREKRKPVFKGN